MANFGTLWVGNPMTKIQEISLSSFVYHGHSLTIFLYDMNIEVPLGVKKEDARKIVPEEKIFVVHDSYAGFSDMFRYQMINKTGLIWVDADTICLRPDWDFKDNIFASEENGKDGLFVVNGVLSLPSESDIVKYLVEESENSDKTTLEWATLGPFLVTSAFKKFNYMEYVYPNYVFSGLSPAHALSLWNSKKLNFVMSLCKNSHSISIYNSMCVATGVDRNFLRPGTAIEYYYNKFVTRTVE